MWTTKLEWTGDRWDVRLEREGVAVAVTPWDVWMTLEATQMAARSEEPQAPYLTVQ